MEVIVTIVIVGLVLWVFLQLIGGSSKNTSDAPHTRRRIESSARTTPSAPAHFFPRYFEPAYKFELRMSSVMTTLQEGLEPMSAVKVEMRGTVEAPYDGFRAGLSVHFMDVTDRDSPRPVLSLAPFFQESATLSFEFSPNNHLTLFETTEFSRWADICEIPLDFLKFPKKGRRRIEGQICLFSQDNPIEFEYGIPTGGIPRLQFLTFAHSTTEVEVHETGYTELVENAQKMRDATIELSMFISATDGSLDGLEANVIRTWAQKQLGDEADETEKSELNEIIRTSYQAATENTLSFSDILRTLNDYGTDTSRHEALTLAVEVMAADGSALTEELSILSELSDGLNISESFYKSLLAEKAVLLNTDKDEVGDTLLGIIPGMPESEIRSLLAELFSQYNSRTNNQNPEIRDQAKEMLLKIAAARKRHL